MGLRRTIGVLLLVGVAPGLCMVAAPAMAAVSAGAQLAAGPGHCHAEAGCAPSACCGPALKASNQASAGDAAVAPCTPVTGAARPDASVVAAPPAAASRGPALRASPLRC